MRATAPDSEQPKAQYKCPTCGRKFVTKVEPDVKCRKCKVPALTICRRCKHARPWAFPTLQICKPCGDFLNFRASGGLTDTPTGRLSDRISRAQHWTGKSSPSSPIPYKRSRFTDAENHPRVTAFAHDMRGAPTPAEARLNGLIQRLLPSEFEVQWVFGDGDKRFILDFFIPKVRLGIEVDGAQHLEDKQRIIDKAKETAAKSKEITIVRITNDRCMEASDAQLTEWLREAWRRSAQAQRAWKGNS